MEKIGVVVHELRRTGSPIVGLSIAGFFYEQGHQVHVFAKEGGELQNDKTFLGSNGLPLPLTITKTGHARRPKISRSQARQLARQSLEAQNIDVLYVNSFASAEWCLAANDLDIPVFFHTHELKSTIAELRRAKIFSYRFRPRIRGLISASSMGLKIARKTLGYKLGAPSMIMTSFVDLDRLEVTTSQPPQALTASGDKYDWSKVKSAPLICMCGAAVHAKGVDLFFEAAATYPEFNFIWIGSFNKSDEPANPIFEKFHQDQLANFYITGSIENPESIFSRSDAMLLTTRLDSNPLILTEALGLQLPAIGFKQALGDSVLLEKYGIALDGNPNIQAILKALSNPTLFEQQRAFLSLDSTKTKISEKIGQQEKFKALYDFAHKNWGRG